MFTLTTVTVPTTDPTGKGHVVWRHATVLRDSENLGDFIFHPESVYGPFGHRGLLGALTDWMIRNGMDWTAIQGDHRLYRSQFGDVSVTEFDFEERP